MQDSLLVPFFFGQAQVRFSRQIDMIPNGIRCHDLGNINNFGCRLSLAGYLNNVTKISSWDLSPMVGYSYIK